MLEVSTKIWTVTEARLIRATIRTKCNKCMEIKTKVKCKTRWIKEETSHHTVSNSSMEDLQEDNSINKRWCNSKCSSSSNIQWIWIQWWTRCKAWIWEDQVLRTIRCNSNLCSRINRCKDSNLEVHPNSNRYNNQYKQNLCSRQHQYRLQHHHLKWRSLIFQISVDQRNLFLTTANCLSQTNSSPTSIHLPMPNLIKRARRARDHRKQSPKKKRSKTTHGRESPAPFSSWQRLTVFQKTQQATQTTSHWVTTNGVSCICTTQSIAQHLTQWSPGFLARRSPTRICTESHKMEELVFKQNKMLMTSASLMSWRQDLREKGMHKIQKKTSRRQLVSQRKGGNKRFKTLRKRD